MDRPYSSEVRKSQGHRNDKFEASGVANAHPQSKKCPVSPFAGNVFKKNEAAIKDKTRVSEANNDNTFGGVNPLTEIGVTPAATDCSKRSDISPTASNKKRLPPAIKAPIYPSSLLQHRIISCPVRRKPLAETLAKTLSLNLPVRAPTVVKPRDSQLSHAIKRSSTTKDDTKKQNKTIQQTTTATSVKKIVTFTQETPSLQENASTITDDATVNQPHPKVDNVSEDNGEKTVTLEKKCAPPTFSSPAVRRICSARGRDIVNPLSKHNDTCGDEDSDDEYEEDYEDESDGSLSESEGEGEDQQSQAASSADNDQPSSPVSTSQQHSSQSPECIDDDCQSAVEENETSSPQEGAPSPSFVKNMAACNSAASGVVKRKVPLYRRKSVFPLFSSIMDMPNTCSLQKLSRETPVHNAASPTESTNDEEKQITLAALDEMREQLKVIASASAPGDYPDDQPKVTPPKKDEVEFYYDMICRLEYTPLKPIADDLILLHTDLPPTEICPTLNRSPSFIGIQNQDDGLLSGRSSPKLDIPHRRYCGYKIRQHPLAKYTLKMKKPVKQSSSEGCKGDVTTLKLVQTTEHQQVEEQVEDHPSVSDEEEESSSNNNDETSIRSKSQDNKDNVETEHQQIGEQVEMISGEGEVSSSNSSSSNSSSKETGIESDNVEVYTVEQLAVKFGNSVKMEGEPIPKKQKKFKVMPKYNSYEQWYAKKVAQEKVAQEKAVRQSLPVLRSSSYMDAYRKKVYLEKVHKCYNAPLKPPIRYKTSCTQLSKKLTLPPIGVNQRQTAPLVPIPPTETPSTSGPLSVLRNIRRKQYQKKTLQEAVKLVPAHFNYMLDCPQKCLDYVENLEKVKRKQQYSESLRQKQLMTWANKTQRCAKAQP